MRNNDMHVFYASAYHISSNKGAGVLQLSGPVNGILETKLGQ